MNVSQLVGLVGTALVIVGYVPQIHHLIKERCTAGLSLPAFAVWSLASLLFLIHAALIRDVVFIGVQVVNLVAGGVIVAFCKKYDGQVCSYHLRAFRSRHVKVRLNDNPPSRTPPEAPGASRRSHPAGSRATA
jgi:uncharacterized protein with PQ loop repeat